MLCCCFGGQLSCPVCRAKIRFVAPSFALRALAHDAHIAAQRALQLPAAPPPPPPAADVNKQAEEGGEEEQAVRNRRRSAVEGQHNAEPAVAAAGEEKGEAAQGLAPDAEQARVCGSLFFFFFLFLLLAD